VIAATNRIDILDPALLRSGRLDRKIEFPLPGEEARARIMQIHSRKMKVSAAVNFQELARITTDFNGAQLKVLFFLSFFSFRFDVLLCFLFLFSLFFSFGCIIVVVVCCFLFCYFMAFFFLF
jgi:hypothetical protein